MSIPLGKLRVLTLITVIRWKAFLHRDAHVRVKATRMIPATEGEKIFYHDRKLQYTVRVDKPNPLFARALQQAIGGVEGEIRVCMQYMFQAWGARGPAKYRDMLLETGTEEMSHIEMLAQR